MAMALAVAIYLTWRDGLLLHRVVPSLSRSFHHVGAPFHVPHWLRYCLADGLWQYALSALVLGVWHDQPWGWRKLAWTVVPLCTGALIELGQLVGMLEGTFDPMDVAVSIGASALAIAMHHAAKTLGQRGAHA